MSQETLDRWLAEESEVAARIKTGAGPGVARFDRVAGTAGLALKQATCSGALPCTLRSDR